MHVWVFLNCTFTALSSKGPSHSGKAPLGPSGLLGPQGPHELPTKVHNAIQTIDQGTKSTFTQVEPSLKAKRHCLEGFQTPPLATSSQKRKKTEPHFPLHTPPLNSLALKKKKKTPPFQWWRRGSQIYYTKPDPTRQSTSTPNLAKPPLYGTKAL